MADYSRTEVAFFVRLYTHVRDHMATSSEGAFMK